MIPRKQSDAGTGMKKTRKCDWQTEYGTIAGSVLCGADVVPGYRWCVDHNRDWLDNYQRYQLPRCCVACGTEISSRGPRYYTEEGLPLCSFACVTAKREDWRYLVG